MQRIRSILAHAFAIESGKSVTPTDQQADLIDRLCREIVRRGMVSPALIAMEMSRPLNFIGAQTLHFLEPFVASMTDSQSHRHLAEFLEQRGSIDYVCQRLEELDQAQRQVAGDVVRPVDIRLTADAASTTTTHNSGGE